ncbi:MAG TPA: glycoside hydrolase family 3 C-terminal domain-containing protein [Clostridia bacterium]|nr:glycoside hydrolase family 3 C-terminal domain-containing protein [Clostridia bacterium]
MTKANPEDQKTRVKKTLAKMTLEQKAALCDGADSWHLKSFEDPSIPRVMVADGPHGLRKRDPSLKGAGLLGSVPAVCYPTAVTTACSWDTGLLGELGGAIADDCLQENVSVVLGPGVNIKRSPLCGRNFEYFSEDPLLAGELGAAFIQGVQAKGVGTSLKHFAVNNQETRRMTVDAVVDERALREIYLTPFEIAVKKSKPTTVMNAYNRLNGEQCSENDRTQNKILRDEWGFDGVVVSDWGAVNKRAKGLAAGNDLEMPSSNGLGTSVILDAIKSGELSQDVLDTSVERLLHLIFAGEEISKGSFSRDEARQHAIARKIAGQSMVLMKNEDAVLPLKKGVKIAVIGEFAKQPRYQGSGSSLINPTRVDSALDCLKELGVDAQYAAGYKIKSDKPNRARIEEAVKIASGVELAVVFAGLTDDYESEGFDRTHMRLPEAHNELIDAVSAVCPNTVVVLSGGSPVELPWLGRVKGLLNSYLGGQAGAGAVADILTGAVNPSGKLAETYPLRLEDTPCYHNFPGNPATVEYRESLYVGYRYYEKAGKSVAFPFGFGLSYTQFAYSAPRVSKDKIKDDESLTVSFTVKNTGISAGAEVVQLYVAAEQSPVFRPTKELKGFTKVFLEPGEEKEVSIVLEKRAFAFYNTAVSDWHVQSGTYVIGVGASSADMRLELKVEVESTAPDAALPDYSAAPDYKTANILTVADSQFECLLGRPIPATVKDKTLPIVITDNFENAAHTKWGGRINRLLGFVLKHFNKGPNADMVRALAVQTPFRSFIAMSGGLANTKMMEGLLRILNDDKAGKGWRMFLGRVPYILLNIRKLLKTV